MSEGRHPATGKALAQEGVGGEEDMLIEVSALEGAYRYHLSKEKGFLPRLRPVAMLPPPFRDLERAARELPERLAEQDGVRTWIDHLFRDVDHTLYSQVEKLSYASSQTLMLILSLFGHAYRWNTIPPMKDEYDRQTLHLPKHLDHLWSLVAAQIGQLRVAAFWNTNLCNWKLKNASSPIDYALDELTAENIELIYNWLPGPFARDAEVFMCTFILVEARGTHLLAELMRCLRALACENTIGAALALQKICEHFQALYRIYAREIRVSRVRPEIWPTHIQPFFGWNVKTEQGVLGGPSGMNLGCFQVLNSFLGLKHESPLGKETLAYRRYMPPHHRAFLYELDQVAPLARETIASSADQSLKSAFNDLITRVAAWRRDHAERGAVYVQGKQSPGEHLPQTSTGKTLGPSRDRAENYRRHMYERVRETTEAEIPTD
jgi:hypothetical protein